MPEKTLAERIIEWYGGAEPPPPPPLDKHIEMDASPARSFARATDFPFSEHHGLHDVWVRSDRLEEESNIMTRLIEKMKELGLDTEKYVGSTMRVPGSYGEYIPSRRLIHYTSDPKLEKEEPRKSTIWHELMHPVQIANRNIDKDLRKKWMQDNDPRYLSENPERGWELVSDQWEGVPSNRRYENPLAYWVGEMAKGNQPPPGVLEWIKKYRNEE